jgi:hypothetical protein
MHDLFGLKNGYKKRASKTDCSIDDSAASELVFLHQK